MFINCCKIYKMKCWTRRGAVGADQRIRRRGAGRGYVVFDVDDGHASTQLKNDYNITSNGLTSSHQVRNIWVASIESVRPLEFHLQRIPCLKYLLKTHSLINLYRCKHGFFFLLLSFWHRKIVFIRTVFILFDNKTF